MYALLSRRRSCLLGGGGRPRIKRHSFRGDLRLADKYRLPLAKTQVRLQEPEINIEHCGKGDAGAGDQHRDIENFITNRASVEDKFNDNM